MEKKWYNKLQNEEKNLSTEANSKPIQTKSSKWLL
jgi:hypothetical protein